jgi:hypothetical protein
MRATLAVSGAVYCQPTKRATSKTMPEFGERRD